MNYIVTTTDGELYHYGISGQKWGVRRYQNPDGTLTEAGKKRYGKITVTPIGQSSIGKTNNVDTVRISKGTKYADLPTELLYENEEYVKKAIIKSIAESNNLTLKQAKKFLDSADKNTQNIVQDAFDNTMENILSQIIDKYGINNTESNTKETKASEKPKYTQKQAINKIYSDLEKK